MTLSEFLEVNGITDAEFARRIGAGSRMTVGRYRRHERIPRPKPMERIVAATEGKVTPADFYRSVGSA